MNKELRKDNTCDYITKTLIPLENEYPLSLKSLPEPPKAVYYRGSLPDETLPRVAVIGARSCSEYGREQAAYFGSALAKAGVQIISGMALGVDGHAQLAALRSGGKSFAVLGCGCDICYPAANKRLYELLQSQGGIISEYPDKTEAKAFHFPLRNRIISALSDIILVIEARLKSGTQITVNYALEQGREVFALPGRLSDSLSHGCNLLIKQGAGIATEPEDILEALERMGKYPSLLKSSKNSSSDMESHINDASDSCGAESIDRIRDKTQRMIFNCVGDRPTSLDEIYNRLTEQNRALTSSDGIKITHDILYGEAPCVEAPPVPVNLSISQLMQQLLEMCRLGYIRSSGGGSYEQLQSSAAIQTHT